MKQRSVLVAVLAFVTIMSGFAAATPNRVAGASQAILSAGPLTRVEISDDLNCAVDHTGDTAPEFYGDTACATLVAVGGTLYGPASIPAGDSAAPRTTFTPISQSAVTGAGTNANPFKIVTVVGLGSTSLQVTQTDSYVVGQETYRTDVAIANSGGSAASAVLYRAGDCYLQNSDYGFGAYDSATGAVSCVAGVDDGSGTIVPGTRIEQWYPLSAGSSYTEDFYATVWGQIGTQAAFPNTCAQCSSYIDNGAGLSWNVTVPANGSATRSNLTVFSPLGTEPLSTTKTAALSSVAAGESDSYTITVSNGNTEAATLSSITDTLPNGFSYTPGSTTGATAANPGVAGQVLTWSGPFTVPAEGSLSLTFGVTVSAVPGTYTNEATATAQGQFTVAGTGPTAPVTVTGTSEDPMYFSILLDRSYSMQKNRAGTIATYNDYLADQQAAHPQARATLALFSSCGYRRRGPAGQLITDLPMLTKATYKPSCRTPLYDAIARAINRAANNPLSAGEVTITILTDGLENASINWTFQEVDSLIADKVADGWTFVWLGNSLDPLVQKWAARE